VVERLWQVADCAGGTADRNKSPGAAEMAELPISSPRPVRASVLSSRHPVVRAGTAVDRSIRREDSHCDRDEFRSRHSFIRWHPAMPATSSASAEPTKLMSASKLAGSRRSRRRRLWEMPSQGYHAVRYYDRSDDLGARPSGVEEDRSVTGRIFQSTRTPAAFALAATCALRPKTRSGARSQGPRMTTISPSPTSRRGDRRRHLGDIMVWACETNLPTIPSWQGAGNFSGWITASTAFRKFGHPTPPRGWSMRLRLPGGESRMKRPIPRRAAVVGDRRA